MELANLYRMLTWLIVFELVFVYVYFGFLGSIQVRNARQNNSEWVKRLSRTFSSEITNTTKPTETTIYGDLPHWLPGCEKIFLDLGANIGVTVRKLFEPEKYPKSRMINFFFKTFGYEWLQVSMIWFPRRLCALGFEPNPKHHRRLQKLQAEYSQKNWNVHFFPFAVSNGNGNITFYTRDNCPNEDWGASIYKSLNSSIKQTPVTVKRIRLAHFIKNVLKNAHIAIAKMDIEGEEFPVLEDLASENLLCRERIDTITIEYHDTPFQGNEIVMESRIAEIKKKIQQQNCVAAKIVEFDDETYHHDNNKIWG